MSAKMRRHGIHAFLEIFRYKFSKILNHILIFVYCAYSMISLFFKIVSTFENICTKCLDDLGRYCMAIEDEIFMNRNV